MRRSAGEEEDKAPTKVVEVGRRIPAGEWSVRRREKVPGATVGLSGAAAARGGMGAVAGGRSTSWRGEGARAAAAGGTGGRRSRSRRWGRRQIGRAHV